MKKMVLALVVALALSGCVKKTAISPASAPLEKVTAGESITVVLDWTPNTNHTGLYAAQALGYFAAEGLDVSLIQPPEDGAVLLTASGEAQFGVDFQESLGPALANKDAPLPVTAVAAIIAHNTSGLMQLRSSGITRPRDLEGKRFASWGTPLVTAVVKNIVEADGGDFSKVKIIPNTAVDAFSALETDIDSIWIYYAWDGVAAEVRNVPISYFDLGALNPVFDWYTPVIIANNAFLAEKPEIARAFLRAVRKGYEYAMENPDAAADILLKAAPELAGDASSVALVKASQNYLSTRYAEDETDGGRRWGHIDALRWNTFYAWMYGQGLLETDLSTKNGVSADDSGACGFTNEYLE